MVEGLDYYSEKGNQFLVFPCRADIPVAQQVMMLLLRLVVDDFIRVRIASTALDSGDYWLRLCC